MQVVTQPRLIFREDQQFRQELSCFTLFIPFTVAVVLLVFALLAQTGGGWGPGFFHKPQFLAFLAIAVGGLAAAMILVLVSRLTTEVREDGLYVQFFPFHPSLKSISLEGLKRVEIVTYKPIRDYGGYGIKYGFRNGWAYNVSGDRGVKLFFVKKAPLLIGSQRPEELAQAIGQLKERQW